VPRPAHDGGIGELELVSLRTLRERAKSGRALPGRLKVSMVRGDVRHTHQAPENTGALFQVAVGGGSRSPDCALLRNPQDSPDFARAHPGYERARARTA
jgi:hypothetical protein